MNNDSFKDYYKILQVDRNAAQDVITVAYRSLARKYHPDLNLNNSDEANEKMKAINEAYRILSDVESRRKYNLTYDSYIKKDINNSNINSSNINNSSVNDSSVSTNFNSYVTRKSRKEYTKQYNSKRFNFLKSKKRNLAIAGIVAILFTCMIAGKILISNDYSASGKNERGIGTNVKQTDRMRPDFDSNHLNNPDSNSERPDRKSGSDHDR